MVDLIDIADDLKKPSKKQQGGIAQHIYYALQDDFKKDGIAQLPDPAQNLADFVEIQQDHQLKPGRYWKKVYCSLMKGQYQTEVSGEKDSRIMKVTTTAYLPNKESKALGSFNALLDENVIVLVPLVGKNCNDVEYMQVGDGCLWAEIMPAFDTGQGPEAERGTTLTIEGYHLLKYKGNIITSEDVDSSDSAS